MVRGMSARSAGRLIASTPLGNTSCGSGVTPMERTASPVSDNRAAVTGAVGGYRPRCRASIGSPLSLLEDGAGGGTPSWSSAMRAQ